MRRRLRILTWHVHGNYLYYLTQAPHEFFLVADAARSPQHSGRSGTLPWGDNVHDAPVERLREMAFDVVLFQSRAGWDERHALLSEAQLKLPCIYLEHDPPQAHPTDSRHWVADPNVLLVQVTPFNALMWDPGPTPVRVIEHGVKPLADAAWRGERERGLVVVNNLDRRGRRLGLDVYLDAARQVPLTLVGMGSERIAGGAGEVPQRELPGVMASHRFFFHPIRWTSLGLALVEAMGIGVPVVALATTEAAALLRDGDNGFVDTRPARLVEAMRQLLADRALAARIGAAGQATARERFGIERFVADWCDALATVAG